MKKQTCLLVFGLLSCLGYAQPNTEAKLTSYFDKILAEQFKPAETGATVLVARNGRVIYEKAFGLANLESNVPMQPDNVFRIASITKQFTAVAILQLMEQGKLNLQDQITRFIPDYPTKGNKITIEHLLSHTSGLPNNNDMPEYMGQVNVKPSEMIDHFKDLPLKFAPGTNWSYSNNGYFLLGYIIEKITGKTYAEYLEERFFKPLGMTQSLYANDIKIIKNRAAGYTHGDHGYENAQLLNVTHPFAAGSIQSTVGDLFKWHQAVHAYRVIKKENLDKALTRYKLTDGTATAYGYGWRLGNVYDSPSIWHGGLISGYMSMAIYLPKEDVFVAVFSNCDCNSPADIASKLAALAAGKPYEYQEISMGNNVLQDYIGVYENLKGLQRLITVSENKLFSQLGRGPKGHLKAHQKDHFFFENNAMVTLEFSRNKKGQIDKLTSKNLSGNDSWTKTNKPIPGENGIKVDEKLLEKYTGHYEMSPDFSFSVTKEQQSLFLETPGQEKLEMFAETETKFFLKVNDAQFEFIKDSLGNITKVILNQGGRQAEAKRIK